MKARKTSVIPFYFEISYLRAFVIAKKLLYHSYFCIFSVGKSIAAENLNGGGNLKQIKKLFIDI